MQPWALALATLAVACCPALAQDASGCGKFKWSVERERSAFGTPGLQQVASGQRLPGIMDPAAVTLKPSADVAFVLPPGRKPPADTFGGVFLTPPLPVGGIYQVTLSDEAWVDVIQDHTELRPKAFSGERDCPNVRKSLRFDLKGGDATIQISGAHATSLKIDLLPPE